MGVKGKGQKVGMWEGEKFIKKFESVNEVARFLLVSPSSVYEYISDHPDARPHRKYTFKYVSGDIV